MPAAMPQALTLNRRNALRLGALTAASALAGPAMQAAQTSSAHPQPDYTLPTIPPLLTEFVFQAEVSIGPAVEVGPTPEGIRRYIPILGGTFLGPRLRGRVLPGGADWQLQRPDGPTEVNALYSIETNDNTVLIVHNRGLLTDNGHYFRTTPAFQAPNGQYSWLNQSIFTGSALAAPHPNAVLIRVFRVL